MASAEGLAAAAVHAKLLADRDEHEMEKLAVGVVEMQMRKIELKLRQMEDLDAGLARERAAVDRMFAAIAAERGREEKTRKEAEARAKSAEEEEARRRDAEAAAAAAAEAAAEAEPAAKSRRCWLRRRRRRRLKTSRGLGPVSCFLLVVSAMVYWPSCVPIRPYSISGATPPRRRI